ncbi:NAD(P)H-dependent flavin oxidoreductase [Micromonospora cathayae]|uniref:Propionate 3-nitronate monooxygenase n=1 Tax=Micromonospora cathayae TaxID=3028804 RepID=A0ABY7ZPU9_9ACTN|nr:nitronate monooxygenase [Micromonospora sp. HUAS 3]WDZ85041.1 nitronate monooxygenase [Micromonospora sp. HUAS 3]
MVDLPPLRHPLVAAPMAGGPSTPRLVAAVGQAGGLGFLAAGYRRPEQVGEEIRQVRQLTGASFGVNVLLPGAARATEAEIAAYAATLRPDAQRLDVALGEPVADDDHLDEKIDLLCQERVPVVSFAFGLPTGATVERLHAAGTCVLVTVTTPDEAVAAAETGADGVVAQGIEAGGHRGGFTDRVGVGEYGLLTLLRLVARVSRLPVVAAGGLMDGHSVAAALTAGATAAQLGTAFLRCPEAGTNPVHRAVLGGSRETVVTRAFTGRRARSIVNGFASRQSTVPPPAAYPHVHRLTAPLRRAAVAAGDTETASLWAGQGHALIRELPAGELVRQLAAETHTALAATRHPPGG